MTIDSPAAAASDAPVRPIREWHALTLEEQSAEWTALVGWVTWIHDLYELSREERLPLCWPQHPGLVEELRSLKIWRDVLYTSRDSGGAHSPAPGTENCAKPSLPQATSGPRPAGRVTPAPLY